MTITDSDVERACETFWGPDTWTDFDKGRQVVDRKDMRRALEQFAGSSWIKCSERMPESQQTVIVEGGVALYLGEGKWYSYMTPDQRVIQWKVTHWAPLPLPPPPEVGA